MNEQNITALLALLALLLYFIIGRTIINLMDAERIEPDEWKFFKILAFPMVVVWELVVMMSNYLTDTIIGFLDHHDRTRSKRNRSLRNR